MPPNRFAIALMLCALPQMLWAEAQSLFRQGNFANAGRALIQQDEADTQDLRSASLFIGIDGKSFFRPYPVRRRPSDGSVILNGTGSAVARLRSLISHAESRREGYDAVQYGARIRPGKRPTQLTIGEIFAWIDATPGQPHAIGRYQFIPPTLDRLVRHLDVPPGAVFSPQLQDQLADVLLAEAGFNAFRAGEISRTQFMNNLARLWAGLPNSTGKSHYHGYAGNKAAITWAQYEAEMKRIFPG